MRLVYTADLHRTAAGYRQLLDLAAEQRAAAVIVGGDLLRRSGIHSSALPIHPGASARSARA